MVDHRPNIALANDLYQLTMGASYYANNRNGMAKFSLFVRRLPERRNFLVAAGLDDALDRLIRLQFSPEELDYLRSIGQVRTDFIESLAAFRFGGTVRAVPEGRVIFANEPLIEVTAPILEAQLAETVILNALHYPTLVASKAARCVSAAAGAMLVEFGLRRTPSIDAGLAAARAAYLAGFVATSNLLAGKRFGIPVSGTVAHSFIQVFENELEAFQAFADTFPGPVTLLIDTYDTVQGAHHAVEIARGLRERGGQVRAVRLDSGDLVQLSRAVRQVLDDAGFPEIQIFASGGLDEYDIEHLKAVGAPIDGFGIGTRLGTSADAPSLDMAYKLVEYEGRWRLKLSTGKLNVGGGKQVWRRSAPDGRFLEDIISSESEPAPGTVWEPLLEPVMVDGKVVRRPSLDESRRLHREEMQRLPASLLATGPAGPYPVSLSPELSRRQQQMIQDLRRIEGLPDPTDS